MQFIPTRFHGMFDYLFGVLLVASPWLFGFADDGAEMWVPIAIGAAVIVYSLLTRYELGVTRVIPMTTHLALDAVGGVVLAASPWLFGFADNIWWPHVLFGAVELVAAALTQHRPERGLHGTSVPQMA